MSDKTKFALIKWKNENGKFDVIELKNVIKDKNQNHEIDKTYKVFYKGKKYDAVLKLIGKALF